MGIRKSFLIVILTILNLPIFAQNYRVMYNYHFKSDSTNIKSFHDEDMILDIDETGSVFYSLPAFQYDSLYIEKRKTNSFPEYSDTSKIKFFVKKMYPSYSLELHTNLDIAEFAVKDSIKIKWSILQEKDSLKGFSVQKATADFGGRFWTAWFCSKIPIPEGPYKFNGLPGLILKIEDSTKSHLFTFIGLEKSKARKEYFNSIKKKKNKVIDNFTFNKLWHEYKKDPAKSSKFLLLNSNTSFSVSFNGGPVRHTREILLDIEKEEIEKIKKDNNFIELKLYE